MWNFNIKETKTKLTKEDWNLKGTASYTDQLIEQQNPEFRML